jgi:hypothetical protein
VVFWSHAACCCALASALWPLVPRSFAYSPLSPSARVAGVVFTRYAHTRARRRHVSSPKQLCTRVACSARARALSLSSRTHEPHRRRAPRRGGVRPTPSSRTPPWRLALPPRPSACCTPVASPADVHTPTHTLTLEFTWPALPDDALAFASTARYRSARWWIYSVRLFMHDARTHIRVCVLVRSLKADAAIRCRPEQRRSVKPVRPPPSRTVVQVTQHDTHAP